MTRPRLRGVKPRDYQVEAAEWALSRGRAVVVMPTGSGKTVVAALWAARLLAAGAARRVLFLEPTRIMVEQVRAFLSRVLEGVRVEAVYGPVPRGERARLWREATIAVATPETALSDIGEVRAAGYDAIVVDEAHHAVGRDSYAQVLRLLDAPYRLGLTAYLPPQRRAEVESLIGPHRQWSWTDPRIAPYVPPWIGEVLEAPLNEAERRLYDELEAMAAELEGRLRGLARLAQRWLARDGAEALRESESRPTTLASLLRRLHDLLWDPRVRPAHKLPALLELLDSRRGLGKAIVFIDRVAVARYTASRLEEEGYGVVLIAGRGHMTREEVARALEDARSPRVDVIVSTSAGEEGLDLPEARLLVVWSNVAAPLRFIQRHGRVRRATGRRGPPRIVAYIVTPDTVDMDSFVEGLEYALEAGVDIPVDPSLIERLRERTQAARLERILEEKPMPLEWAADLAGLAPDRARAHARRLARQGRLVYIHTPTGRVYAASTAIHKLYEDYPEYLDPDPNTRATLTLTLQGGGKRSHRGTHPQLLKRATATIARTPAVSARVTVEAPLPGGATALVNLSYNYLVDTEDKLRLILDNALTPTVYKARAPALSNS